MGLSLGACVPNLKFVPLVILELLAFNAQKFKGSRPLFEKKFRGHAGTFPGSMHAKFEVRTFNRFEGISPPILRGHVTLATPLIALF